MLIKKDVTQNTEEWLDWRKSKIGASDAPIIMRRSPWKSPEMLYEEKLGIREGGYENASMARGKALEPEAREALEKELKTSLSPEVCVHDKYDYIVASLDGLSKDQDLAVEIKCPGWKTHQMAMDGTIPDHYKIQMQHQMAVTGLDQIVYYSYDGSCGVILECKKDQNLIDDMLELEQEFYDCITKKVPPEDKNIRMDDAWVNYTNFLKEVQKKKKELEKKEKEYKEKLIELADGKTSYGNGVKVMEIERKGTVDYSKIPVLKTIDLEKYRKKSLKYWSIR